MLKKWKMNQVKKLDEDIYLLVLNRVKIRVNVSDKSCECSEFFDRGTCSHLVYLSHCLEMNLGYYAPVKKFAFLKKRGRPKNAKKALVKD